MVSEIKMELVYNKLVRDKIPNIIEDKEVIEASGYDRLEELADMLEVIRALANLENKNLNDIIDIANKKNKKRGAFDEKIFLEKVIESE